MFTNGRCVILLMSFWKGVMMSKHKKIQIRVTKEEKDFIQLGAKLSDRSVSNFMIHAAKVLVQRLENE